MIMQVLSITASIYRQLTMHLVVSTQIFFFLIFVRKGSSSRGTTLYFLSLVQQITGTQATRQAKIVTSEYKLIHDLSENYSQ